jgi:hypothetical protein
MLWTEVSLAAVVTCIRNHQMWILDGQRLPVELCWPLLPLLRLLGLLPLLDQVIHRR